jgi:branched-chain amino acid transport system permease protein
MEYFLHILIMCCIYGSLAISLDLLVGYTGLLSLSHAAFYGFGAYGVALLMLNFGFSFWLSLLVCIFGAMFLAICVGSVMSRFRDDYYVLVSLGFGIIFYNILLNWQSLTRGPLGIAGITRPQFFSFTFENNVSFLILVALFLALVFVISQTITKSSFGRTLQAIREDEKVLQLFGYKTSHSKLLIFMITAAIAACAGGFFAVYISFIDPTSFVIGESILVLAMIILGGLANSRGAILGAFLLMIIPELLRFVGFPSDIAAQMRQVVYGAILVGLMLYWPKGIMGKYQL